MKKIIILIFITCGINVFAQSGNLAFLKLNSDARNTGMGNVVMGEANGMYLYSNPTSFLNDKKNIYASYTLGMLPKVKDDRLMFHSVSAGYKKGKNALLVGFRYLGGLQIPKVTNSGTTSKKKIKPNDYSLDLAYTRDLGNKFSAYIKGSFIQSHIGKTAYTGNFGTGVYYRNAFKLSSKKVSYTFGLGVYDLGAGVKFGKKTNSQPTSVGLGGSFGTELAKNHNLNLAWTTRYFALPTNSSETTASLGLEYELYNMVGLRAGYHMEDGNNITTFGLGYKQKYFNLNVGYQMGNDNNLFLGISTSF